MMHDIVNKGAWSVLLLGDVILDVPDPDHWLSGIAPATRGATLSIAHLEVPHTLRGFELGGDVPAPGADPAHLAALARAGIGMVSLAGNHMADCGPVGIADTIATLDELGIAHCGAGMDLGDARKPAIHTGPDGRRLALLNYNCVGPENAWAADDRAGTAYLPIETDNGAPVAPAAPLVRLTDKARAILGEDIAAARREAGLVVVALHKGVVHTPAHLAPYERPLAQAAIDAGADVVIGHHAHIVQGIERYRDRPIYHGLGNGCVVTHALSPDQDHPARADWARRRKALFGFEPDPAYTLAPFHPEAVNAMIGRLVWHADGRLEAGLLPVHVEAPGRPVLADAATGRRIGDYIERITARSGLPPLRLQSAADGLVIA